MSLWQLWKGRSPDVCHVRDAVPGETLETAAMRLYGCSRAARDLVRAHEGRSETSVLEGGERLTVPHPALHRRWEDAWSESIASPQDVVFDVLATQFFASCERWVYRPGTVRSFAPAPVRTGSIGTLDWDEGHGRDDAEQSPARWRVCLEVTVYDPPHAFAWRASHGELGGYESYRFALEREAGGTHVRGSYKNETARRWNSFRRVNGYTHAGLIPAMRRLRAMVESELRVGPALR